ncbi:MAG: ankyrin repeat domain-containing protein [Victivallales bacterium]|jgi:ankyrin repeat protein
MKTYLRAYRILGTIIACLALAGCSKLSLNEEFNYAISGGNIQEVQNVLIKVPKSEKNKFINHGLYYAALSAKTILVKYFIEQKADINSIHAFGETALFRPVIDDNMDMIELLIKNGADVNIPDRNGATPLTVAICNKNDKVVKYLIKSCTDFSTCKPISYTPLMFLIESKSPNSYEIAKLLIEKKIDLNSHKQDDGYTALMVAVSYKNAELVRLLLENGAMTDIKNKFNKTALDIAISDKSDEIIKLLSVKREKPDAVPIQSSPSLNEIIN